MAKKLKHIIPLPGSPESDAFIAEECKESRLVFTQPPSETYLIRDVHKLSAVTSHLKSTYPELPPIPDEILNRDYEGDGMWDNIIITVFDTPNGKLFTFTVIDHRLWC